MAIQQSINQLLQSTQFAAALYAHQPEVQQRRAEERELRNLTKEMDEAEAYRKGSTEAQKQATEKLFVAAGAPDPSKYELGADSTEWQEDYGKWLDELQEKHGLDDAAMAEVINIQAPMRANIHTSKSWAQMTARRRQLDPAYREQEYQKQIDKQMKGKNKTVQALQDLYAGKLDAEGFKEKVMKKEDEQPAKKGKGKVKKNGK